MSMLHSITYVDGYVIHYAIVTCEECGMDYFQRTTDDRVECYACEDEMIKGNSRLRTRGI